MTTYQISNSRSGAILGNYSGNTEAEALDAMAKDAGYRDYTHCQQVAPCDGLELMALPFNNTLRGRIE